MRDQLPKFPWSQECGIVNFNTSNQHGFLSKKSTITNLLECTFDWVSFYNNREVFDIVYIDYEKAIHLYFFDYPKI